MKTNQITEIYLWRFANIDLGYEVDEFRGYAHWRRQETTVLSTNDKEEAQRVAENLAALYNVPLVLKGWT